MITVGDFFNKHKDVLEKRTKLYYWLKTKRLNSVKKYGIVFVKEDEKAEELIKSLSAPQQ